MSKEKSGNDPVKAETIGQKLRIYALEHPGAALSICTLTSGGLLLLLYFIRIGFLPDIALESAATLLYAAAILGLFTLAVIAMYLVLPALIAKACWHDYKTQGRLTKEFAVLLSCAAQMFSWLSTLAGLLYWPELSQRYVWFLGLIPLLTFTLVFSACAYYLTSTSPESDNKEFIDPSQRGLKRWLRHHSGVIWVAGTALFQWCLLSVILLITLRLGAESLRNTEGVDAFAALAIPIFLSVAIQLLLVGLTWDQVLPWAAGSGAISLVLLLIVTKSFSQPSANLVAQLGVGEVSVARLVLNGKGCKQLNLALGGVHCVEVKDEEPTVLCPATLRSRIGSQVLIEVAPMDLVEEQAIKTKDGNKVVMSTTKFVWSDSSKVEGAKRQRVILDKSALLAWSVLSPILKQEEQANGAAQLSNDQKFVNTEPASLIYMSAFNAPNTDLKNSVKAEKQEKALKDLCGSPPPFTSDIKDEKDKSKPPPLPPKPVPPKRLPPKQTDCCCVPVSVRVIAPLYSENAEAGN